MKRMRVIGTGSYLPDRVVTNGEVAEPLGLSAAQIERFVAGLTDGSIGSDQNDSSGRRSRPRTYTPTV